MSLIHTHGRVVVKVDIEEKNSHTFSDGTKIRLERDWENLNKRETQPVNATVISGEGIPTGARILVHHNATHEVNKINNYLNLSGEQEASSVKYYSIPEAECFAWKEGGGEYQPMKNFAFALRVFRPYKGALVGIEPTIIKNVLFITTGELKDTIVHTLISCDYEIVFQGDSGREERLIRLRHSEDPDFDREEVVAISHDLTKELQAGDLLVGLTTSDAKPLEITAYAD